MNATERREVVERQHQSIVAAGRNLSNEDLEFVATAAFPAGSLPDHPAPPKFTERELEMFRELVWMTEEREMRVSGGKMGLFARRNRKATGIGRENHESSRD